MKLICDEMLKLLLKSVKAALPDKFTGEVTVQINFHDGTPATAVFGCKEGTKLKHLETVF